MITTGKYINKTFKFAEQDTNYCLWLCRQKYVANQSLCWFKEYLIDCEIVTECPVCYKYRELVQMCRNEHGVCQPCKTKIQQCCLCREELLNKTIKCCLCKKFKDTSEIIQSLFYEHICLSCENEQLSTNERYHNFIFHGNVFLGLKNKLVVKMNDSRFKIFIVKFKGIKKQEHEQLEQILNSVVTQPINCIQDLNITVIIKQEPKRLRYTMVFTGQYFLIGKD